MNINTEISKASADGNLEKVKLLVKNGADITSNEVPVNEASYFGHLEVVKFLAENGANITSNEYPIKMSIINGHLDIVNFLVENGADVTSSDHFISIASGNGHLNIVKFLVESGSPISNNTIKFRSSNNDITLYLMSVSKNATDICDEFDEAISKEGITVFNYSKDNGILRYLVKSFLSKNNMSPYDFILKYPDMHTEILMELICE